MGKAPAFQFYAKDWLSHADVCIMTPTQRGYYIQLLAQAWNSEPIGALPNDPEKLWRLAGASSRDEFEKESKLVLAQFKKRGKYLSNGRLEEEREKQIAFALKQSAAGRSSGKSRKEKALSLNSGSTVVQFGSDLVATEDEPKRTLQSALCTLQSSSALQEHIHTFSAREDSASPEKLKRKALDWACYNAKPYQRLLSAYSAALKGSESPSSTDELKELVATIAFDCGAPPDIAHTLLLILDPSEANTWM